MTDFTANADVIVYTKNNCSQCEQTKTLLKKLNIPFNEINLEDNPDVLPFLRSEGFMSAPVVMTDDESWSGFQPDKIHSMVGGSSSEATEDSDWDF